MSDRIGPELAAEVGRRAERHLYASHPAALVLADHIAAWRAQPTARVVCDCDWIGPSCDHIPHVVEVLHRAGLLADGPPPETPTRDPHRASPRREGRQEDDVSDLDLPAGDPAPAERIAATRRDLDETIVAWRGRRTARAVLFVGGGWHGHLRALRPEDHSIILVESLDDPAALFSLATGTPASSEPLRIRRSRYRREEYATLDGDTVTTVEVWHHEDVAAGTPEGYKLVADAALRALASTGMIDSHTRRRSPETSIQSTATDSQ